MTHGFPDDSWISAMTLKTSTFQTSTVRTSTFEASPLRHAPKVAIYVAAAAVAVLAAAVASQSTVVETTPSEPILTLAQPSLDRADGLIALRDGLAANAEAPTVVSSPDKAPSTPKAAVTLASDPAPPMPKPQQIASTATASGTAAAKVAAPAKLPPLPVARPSCIDACGPKPVAEAPPRQAETAAPQQVASLEFDTSTAPAATSVADPNDPVPPMPVGPTEVNQRPGMLARSGQMIGAVWGWSGHAVNGLVREVRSRTF